MTNAVSQLNERQAIVFDHLSKKFSLHHESEPTLKQAFVSSLQRLSQVEEFWALKDINLQVSPGEVVGIVGKNGSGKSTLLRIAAGILTPDYGRVRLHGQISSFLDLGAGFHPDLNGRENIFLFGTILGMAREQIERAYQAIVEFSGLGKFIDVPIRNYSSGMSARLGFAVAVSIEPDILLIDEVLSVGDFIFQQKCFNKLQDFKRAGKTILMVSHSLGAIDRLCTRAICLHRGEVVIDGEVHTALEYYLERVKEEDEWTRELLRREEILAARRREGEEREKRRLEREDFIMKMRQMEIEQEQRRKRDQGQWQSAQEAMIAEQQRVMEEVRSKKDQMDTACQAYEQLAQQHKLELEREYEILHDKFRRHETELEEKFALRHHQLIEEFELKKLQLRSGLEQNEWLGSLHQFGRWGDKRLEIVAISLLDEEEKPTAQFQSGDGMTIAVDFKVNQPISDPVFRILIFRKDGVFVYGMNTNRMGWRPGTLEGGGRLAVIFPRLQFLRGDYWLSVGAWPDETESFWENRPYDVHNLQHEFSVTDDKCYGGNGVCYLPSRWEITVDKQEPWSLLIA